MLIKIFCDIINLGAARALVANNQITVLFPVVRRHLGERECFGHRRGAGRGVLQRALRLWDRLQSGVREAPSTTIARTVRVCRVALAA